MAIIDCECECQVLGSRQATRTIDAYPSLPCKTTCEAAGLEVAVRAWWHGAPGRRGNRAQLQNSWLHKVVSKGVDGGAQARLERSGIPGNVIKAGLQLAQLLIQNAELHEEWKLVGQHLHSLKKPSDIASHLVNKLLSSFEIEIHPDTQEHLCVGGQRCMTLTPRTSPTVTCSSELSSTGTPQTCSKACAKGSVRAPRQRRCTTEFSHGSQSPQQLPNLEPSSPEMLFRSSASQSRQQPCESQPPLKSWSPDALKSMYSYRPLSGCQIYRTPQPENPVRRAASVAEGGLKRNTCRPSHTGAKKTQTWPVRAKVEPSGDKVVSCHVAAENRMSTQSVRIDSTQNLRARKRSSSQKRSSFGQWLAKTKKLQEEFENLGEKDAYVTTDMDHGSKKQTNQVVCDMEEVRRLFRYFDNDNSGFIDPAEFVCLLSRLKRQPKRDMDMEEVWRDWDSIDTDGSGSVSFDEFKTWYCNNFGIFDDTDFSDFFRVEGLVPDDELILRDVAEKVDVDIIEVEKMWKEFKLLDTDQSGFLEYDEFKQLVQRRVVSSCPRSSAQKLEVAPKVLDMFWHDADVDGSGKVSFEEFTRWFLKVFHNGLSPMEQYYRMLGHGRNL